jgi:hypothetical protein
LGRRLKAPSLLRILRALSLSLYLSLSLSLSGSLPYLHPGALGCGQQHRTVGEAEALLVVGFVNFFDASVLAALWVTGGGGGRQRMGY